VYPIQSESDLHGAVALRFAGAVPAHAADWLRWGMGWMLERLARKEASDGASWRERLYLTLDLLTLVMDQPNAVSAAQAAVTEASQRLGCERVSVGFVSRGSARLAALSHSADFSQRLDLTRALEGAMNEGIDQGQRVLCGEAKPRGEDRFVLMREHERLRREFDAEVVLSVPFVSGDEQGIFVFEWAYGPVEEDQLGLAESLSPLLGRALADRRRADRPWYARVGRGLAAEGDKLVGARHGLRKLLVLALVAAAAFAGVAEGDFRVSAHAQLEGGVRRVVAAPYDGFIASSTVRAGHVVNADEVLATLDDRDLKLETSRWESQQAQHLNQAREAQAQGNLAQLQIALAQNRQAEAQRRLSEANLERTRIRAPFSGVIVSGDLSQHLGAAIKKGQTLFEIAPLQSYRVILDIDEADIGHVRAGQKGELVLAALVGERLPLTVSLVTPVAQAREGKNTFRVEAVLDDVIPGLRPGMEGVGKVSIGERHLAWIWTRRFVDWLRLQAWVWMGV
jgi:RND family efflux transporter MFP subunit